MTMPASSNMQRREERETYFFSLLLFLSLSHLRARDAIPRRAERVCWASNVALLLLVGGLHYVLYSMRVRRNWSSWSSRSQRNQFEIPEGKHHPQSG